MMASSDNHELEIEALERASALAARFYTEPAVQNLEREQVFARSWQLAAHAAELAGPGDHVVCSIAGVPALIVRGADGVLRAFHNVCRHRAGCPRGASPASGTSRTCCAVRTRRLDRVRPSSLRVPSLHHESVSVPFSVAPSVSVLHARGRKHEDRAG
jgi:hypothetical protein